MHFLQRESNPQPVPCALAIYLTSSIDYLHINLINYKKNKVMCKGNSMDVPKIGYVTKLETIVANDKTSADRK